MFTLRQAQGDTSTLFQAFFVGGDANHSIERFSEDVISVTNSVVSRYNLHNKFSCGKLSVFLPMFNIINRKTLLEYCRKYPLAAVSLQEWYYELVKSEFKNFNELKQTYSSASLVGDDRVVFNIMGNKYRLVVRVVFSYRVIQIKWFGTHKEYDQIDVNTIQFKKKK